MSTRLQDARIRVTIDTDEAEKDLDDIDKREKQVEEKIEDDKKKVDSTKGTSTSGGGSTIGKIQNVIAQYTGLIDFAAQVAAPLVDGVTQAVINKLPDLLVSDEVKKKIIGEFDQKLTEAEAQIAKLTSAIEAFGPTATAVQQMLGSQIMAGGHPTLPEAKELAEGLFEIQRKRIEIQKKLEREQRELLGREVANTLEDALKGAMSR